MQEDPKINSAIDQKIEQITKACQDLLVGLVLFQNENCSEEAIRFVKAQYAQLRKHADHFIQKELCLDKRSSAQLQQIQPSISSLINHSSGDPIADKSIEGLNIYLFNHFQREESFQTLQETMNSQIALSTLLYFQELNLESQQDSERSYCRLIGEACNEFQRNEEQKQLESFENAVKLHIGTVQELITEQKRALQAIESKLTRFEKAIAQISSRTPEKCSLSIAHETGKEKETGKLMQKKTLSTLNISPLKEDLAQKLFEATCDHALKICEYTFKLYDSKSGQLDILTFFRMREFFAMGKMGYFGNSSKNVDVQMIKPRSRIFKKVNINNAQMIFTLLHNKSSILISTLKESKIYIFSQKSFKLIKVFTPKIQSFSLLQWDKQRVLMGLDNGEIWMISIITLESWFIGRANVTTVLSMIKCKSREQEVGICGVGSVEFRKVEEDYPFTLETLHQCYFRDQSVTSIVEYQPDRFCVSLLDKEELIGLIDTEKQTAKVIFHPANKMNACIQLQMVKGSERIMLIRTMKELLMMDLFSERVITLYKIETDGLPYKLANRWVKMKEGLEGEKKYDLHLWVIKQNSDGKELILSIP